MSGGLSFVSVDGKRPFQKFGDPDILFVIADVGGKNSYVNRNTISSLRSSDVSGHFKLLGRSSAKPIVSIMSIKLKIKPPERHRFG